jgi:hypothetical protein
MWFVDQNYGAKAACGLVLFLWWTKQLEENWKTFQNNLKFATNHKGLIDLKLKC